MDPRTKLHEMMMAIDSTPLTDDELISSVNAALSQSIAANKSTLSVTKVPATQFSQPVDVEKKREEINIDTLMKLNEKDLFEKACYDEKIALLILKMPALYNKLGQALPTFDYRDEFDIHGLSPEQSPHSGESTYYTLGKTSITCAKMIVENPELLKRLRPSYQKELRLTLEIRPVAGNMGF